MTSPQVPPPLHDDAAFDAVLGHVLRFGTLLAGAIVLFGAVVYLARHGHAIPHVGVFHGEPGSLRSVRGVVSDARQFSGRGIIQLGVLALIATPIVRVLFSVVEFVRERDWTYVAITAVVLALLAYSLVGS
jgi:uncharacterized membrane protein